MAYRVNAHFRDNPSRGLLMDVVEAPPPHYGENILVHRHGQDIAVKVTAVWTPFSRHSGQRLDTNVMVEAVEI